MNLTQLVLPLTSRNYTVTFVGIRRTMERQPATKKKNILFFGF